MEILRNKKKTTEKINKKLPIKQSYMSNLIETLARNGYEKIYLEEEKDGEDLIETLCIKKNQKKLYILKRSNFHAFFLPSQKNNSTEIENILEKEEIPWE